VDPRFALLVAPVFLLLALAVYWPAFEGGWFSDDLWYVRGNPYVKQASLRNVADLWNPRGGSVSLNWNYAPVSMSGHVLAWQAFGRDVRGHHAVNVVLHALAAALLVALLRRTSLSRAAALLGGAFFLLHPANVEAVAWISQLKTSAALLLTLLALLAFGQRRWLGALAFALALLAKPTAAVALPVAALFAWSGRERGAATGWGIPAETWRQIAGWCAIFLVFAVIELPAFERANATVAPIDPDPLVRIQTSIAFFARYLAMAVSSAGVSAMHEPGAVRSLLDPWCLAGLALLGGIGARMLWTLRAGRVEAAWWTFALVSYLPVSQLFAFRFPMGDRYLYFMLPGLIGGVLLAARDFAAPLVQARPWVPATAVMLCAAVLVPFTARSYARAELWGDPAQLDAEAARNYPDGTTAHLLRARRSLEAGDTEAAVTALRGAFERGWMQLDDLYVGRAWQSLRDLPAFQHLLRDMARAWLKQFGAIPKPTESELFSLGTAHQVLGDEEAAARAYQRAFSLGGPVGERVQQRMLRMEGRRSGRGDDAAIPGDRGRDR
jgi:tetratricopeptide (TPR) repeat protein